MSSCAVAGCEHQAKTRGLCSTHYNQIRRNGMLLREAELAGPASPLARTTVPGTPCRVDGCDRPSTSRGLCHGHYLRWSRTGDVRVDVPLRPRVRELCAVDGCGRGVKTHGYCRAHYARLLARGDVRADVPIRQVAGVGWQTHGYRGVVVPADLRHLTNGEPHVAEHRLVMALHLGRPLYADESVHHKNGDRLDNRLSNLELWSDRQPSGQRVVDKVAYAIEILMRYRPELLPAQPVQLQIM